MTAQDDRLRLVHHALGVSIALELGDLDRARDEVDDLRDALAHAEAVIDARAATAGAPR
jgi:hypothetical protein